MSQNTDRDDLADLVRGLLAKRADSAGVRAAFESPERFDRGLWQTLCEQVGISALLIPEQYDGAGATIEETAAVLEELGAALAPAPLLSSSIAALALLLGEDEHARADLLPRLAAGEIGTAVWPAAAGDLTLDATAATIVLALEGGSLTLLDAPEVEDVPALDPTLRLGRVTGGRPHRIGAVDEDVLRDLTLVLIAAEQTGCARRGLEMTVAYSKERVQFGRPIGSFQALKHRMADLYVLVETMRSAALGASSAAAAYLAERSEPQREVLALRSAVAASYCSDALERIGSETIQLHGGIGITWEHDAHLVFKRGLALNTLFGPAHTHRARLLPRVGAK